MNDYEDKYYDIDLKEILNREKIEFNIFVIHDLIEQDDKIEKFKKNGKHEEY